MVAVVQQRARQRKARRVRLRRGLLDGRAAGKAQVEQPRDLVERLARGVVQRAAQPSIAPVPGHQDQFRVPAGDDQHQRGEGILHHMLVHREPVAVDVPFQVVDRQQRQPGRKGQPFGRVDADQQTPRQPRPVRDRQRIEVAHLVHARAVQRLADHRLDGKHMLAAGDFGKDAAKAPVQFDLRGDHVGLDGAPVFDDRGRGFVTTGFNGKNTRHSLVSSDGVLSFGVAQISSASASTPNPTSPATLSAAARRAGSARRTGRKRPSSPAR